MLSLFFNVWSRFGPRCALEDVTLKARKPKLALSLSPITATSTGRPNVSVFLAMRCDAGSKKTNETPSEKREAIEAKLPGLSVSQLRQQKKDDLASACMDIAWMCAGQLSQSDILEKTTRPTELSTVMGTVIDKARLLKGESTVITENKLANHRWAEEEMQKLMRKFGWSREEAMEKIKEKAPTFAEMLM